MAISSMEENVPFQFPAGLRVLVVDDDNSFLEITKQTCLKHHYRVITFSDTPSALNYVREKKSCIDVILIEVHMPNMDGYEFLQQVTKETDIPVIMMSLDHATSAVMKAIKHGACDYWNKPLHENQFMTMWKHVARKLVRSETKQPNKDDSEFASFVLDATVKDRRNRDNNFKESNVNAPLRKKPRLVWTPELRHSFVKAVMELGINEAQPKRILEVMNIPGLTKDHVSSYLQKFRLQLKKHNVVILQQNEKPWLNTVQSNGLQQDERSWLSIVQSSGYEKPWPNIVQSNGLQQDEEPWLNTVQSNGLQQDEEPWLNTVQSNGLQQDEEPWPNTVQSNGLQQDEEPWPNTVQSNGLQQDEEPWPNTVQSNGLQQDEEPWPNTVQSNGLQQDEEPWPNTVQSNGLQQDEEPWPNTVQSNGLQQDEEPWPNTVQSNGLQQDEEPWPNTVQFNGLQQDEEPWPNTMQFNGLQQDEEPWPNTVQSNERECSHVRSDLAATGVDTCSVSYEAFDHDEFTNAFFIDM